MNLLPRLLLGVLAAGCAKPADAPVDLRGPASGTTVAPSVDTKDTKDTKDAGSVALALAIEPTASEEPPYEGRVGAGPFVSRCTGVSLVMVSAKPDKYAVDVVLELRNDGPAPLELMTTDDGSCHDMRNPAVTFDLTPNQRSIQARCGNVNGLTANDFVSLAPGMHHKLEWIHGPTPARRGRYTIRATYENDPNAEILRGLAAAPEPALVKRARATVACRVVSNSLTFDWK